jgi:hypothetical protein
VSSSTPRPPTPPPPSNGNQTWAAACRKISSDSPGTSCRRLAREVSATCAESFLNTIRTYMYIIYIYIHTYIHTYIYIYIYMYSLYSLYAYVLIHENILYTYTHKHTYMYMYTYVYVWVCALRLGGEGLRPGVLRLGGGFKRRDAFGGGAGSLLELHEPHMHISKGRTRWHDRLSFESYDFCHAIAIAG